MSSQAFVKNITGVETFNPDILETIADLSNDEVFTPPAVANDMLDTLPVEVWHNPHLRWLDPSVKTGVFLREAAKRLLEGLKNPKTDDMQLAYKLREDEEFRRYWVYKKMLFGLAITDLTALMSRRSLYYTKLAADPNLSVYPMDTHDGNILFKNLKHTYAKDKNGNPTGSCTLCSASLEWNRGDDLESHAYPMLHANQETIIGWFKEANADIKDEENMKFDVIIGNPPYQLANGESSDMPLYHLFIEKAISFEPDYVCMITPSRWFQGGKFLDGFRAKMLKDKRISHIVDYPNSSDVFPSVDIKGGVNYFLWDSSYKDDCLFTLKSGTESKPTKRNLSQFSKFIRHNEGIEIINKVLSSKNFISLSKQVSSQTPFGIYSSFSDFEETPSNTNYRIFARNKVAYANKKHVKKAHPSLHEYKLLIPKAGSDGMKPDMVYSVPIVALPGDICTQTYLVVNQFKTLQEVENMLAYSKTKFFRYMLSLLKNTQDIGKDKFEYVPDLPMTQNWDDAKLYKHFGLDKHPELVAHIEESIREMK